MSSAGRAPNTEPAVVPGPAPVVPGSLGWFRASWAVEHRTAFAVAVGALIATNIVVNRVWPVAVVPWNVTVAVLLVVLARWRGLSWFELGLHRSGLRRGLLIGGLAFALMAAVYGVALAIPATRVAFEDTRAAGGIGMLLYAALVRIPFGTVLLEEIAFRGVLPALIGGGWWRRSLISSVLFGFWHVLPSLGMSTANTAVGNAVGAWGVVMQTALAVLSMVAAGLVLCAIRRWGGHLASPILAHIATNSLAVVIAWLVITP